MTVLCKYKYTQELVNTDTSLFVWKESEIDIQWCDSVYHMTFLRDAIRPKNFIGLFDHIQKSTTSDQGSDKDTQTCLENLCNVLWFSWQEFLSKEPKDFTLTKGSSHRERDVSEGRL